jgi:hypothetical protein
MPARYSAYLGRRVEVLYRSNDIYLPATGTFVGDSGRSIFLEEHFQLKGRMSTFRWEIPYGSITRLAEVQPPTPAPQPESMRLLLELEHENPQEHKSIHWNERPTEG